MKTRIALVLTLAFVVAVVYGCRSTSPKGGIMTEERGFRIQIRDRSMSIQQGDVETARVSLKRGDYFKQDVRLEVSYPRGIRVEPNDVWIAASDRPGVELRVTARVDAALGKYPVTITGTPETGESTSDELMVTVKAR